MKVELLEKLLDAGFSKDEIIELARDQPTQKEPEPATDPEPVKDPEPAKDPEPVKDPEPEKEPVQEDNTGKRLDSIEQSIAKLIKTIQTANVKKDSFGAGQDSLEEQTDRIMASIIRPETEKKKGE